MCGIFAYLGLITKLYQKKLIEEASRIQHRGPDSTHSQLIKNVNKSGSMSLFYVFHRLAINGLDSISEQPIVQDGIYLICNGEIYNTPQIIESGEFKYKTHSDCETIIHLYRKYGASPRLFRELDGVYAFILWDSINKQLVIGRDPIGIRPLFIGYCLDGDYCFASEAKSLVNLVGRGGVEQFPPGQYAVYNFKKNSFNFITHWSIANNITKTSMYDVPSAEYIIEELRELMINAVKKRLMSDRPIGALLSGGLDSSVVCAILCKLLPDRKINTYSVGMRGSPDLKYAQHVAKFLGTNHHSFELSEQEFLEHIDETIYLTESYCTTTIRASVGNSLICKKIREISDDKVIFCGDVSDEIFASYLGFSKSSSMLKLQEANEEMLSKIHFYDVLRSDRTISYAGLEARVPFADRDLMEFVMGWSPIFKSFSTVKMEKYYLRKAFEGWLPDSVLWRRKEAFSDGVSPVKNSWHNIIKKHIYDKKLTDYMIPGDDVYDDESKYYKKIYLKYYPDKLVPKHWKQPFTTNLDPSAREIV